MKKIMMSAALSAIAVAGLAPAAASAQAAPAAAGAVNPTVGAKVYDAQGGDVGTVETVSGDVVTVSTGAAKAGLPKSAFVMRDKGLTIAMTKVQLEAAVNGAKAENSAAKDAKMVPDAPVKSSDGTVIGTISKVEGDLVTVQLTGGAAAALKKETIGLGADGTLAIGMTAADFAKATQSAAAAAPADAATGAAASDATAGAAAEPAQ